MPTVEQQILAAKRVKIDRLRKELAASRAVAPPASEAHALHREVGATQVERTRAQLSAFPPERVEQMRSRLAPVGEAIHDAAPAIGATVATLPLLTTPAGPPAVGARIPGLVTALGRLGTKLIAKPAEGVARAAIGGAVGGELADINEGIDPERAAQNALEQGIADPIGRLTLGLGKFLLRPAGKALGAQTMRLLEFAKKEGLQLDPGAVADKTVPKLITDFARQFLFSRSTSLKQLRAIANHMSADPSEAGTLAKQIAGDFSPDALTRMNNQVMAALARIGGKKGAPKMLEIAGKSTAPGAGAEILFRDIESLTKFRQLATGAEWQAMLQSHTANMIERAATTGANGARVIDGAMLAKELANNAEALKKFYPKGVIERLQNLAVYVKAHAGVPANLAESELLNPASMGTTAIAGGVGMALDPFGVGGTTVALSTALALQVYNSRSFVSRWLTTGLVPKSAVARGVADAAANVGVRNVLGEGVGLASDEYERLSTSP